MPAHTTLAEAEFDRKVCTYWLLSGALIMVFCIITIPLIPFWFIFGFAITSAYLNRMSCTLTDRTLIVRKGIFNRIEKTIPLEKITDLGMKQGPIMRAMDLWGISVETAGSSGSSQSGALVSLVGIKDTKAFRDRVLSQRDTLQGHATDGPIRGSGGAPDVLIDIRDTLRRIEGVMSQS